VNSSRDAICPGFEALSVYTHQFQHFYTKFSLFPARFARSRSPANPAIKT